MIDKIKLKNWKTHLESELVFSNGINIILGNVGTGKSSILDSICFLLFGTFPNLQTRKVKLDDIIMKRPTEKNKCEAVLEFTIDGKKYSVKRVIERGKGTTYSEIRSDGKLLETNTSRVREFVEKILKTNYETFSEAIYSEQNSLDYFLTLGKGQRIKKIDELLMIEKFESARSNCVSVRNKIADTKSGMEVTLDQNKVDDIEENIKQLGDSIKSLKVKSNDLNKELNNIDNKKTSMKKEIKSVSSIDKSIEELEREKNVLNSLLNDVSKTISELEKELAGQKLVDANSIFELKDRISDSELYFKKYSLKHESILTSLADNKSTKKMLEEAISEFSDNVKDKLADRNELDLEKKTFGEDIEKQIKDKKNLLEDTISKAEYIKGRLKDLDLTIKQLNHLEGKCPVCENKLDESAKHKLIDAKKREVVTLSNDLSKAEKNKSSVEKGLEGMYMVWKKIHQLQLNVKGLDSLEKQLENKNKQLEKVKADIENNTKLLEDIEQKLTNVENELRKARENKEKDELLQRKFQELNGSKNKELDIKNKLIEVTDHIMSEKSKMGDRNLDILNSKLKEIEIKEAEYKTKLESVKEMIEEKTSRLSEIKGESDNLKAISKKVKHLDKIILDLKIFEESIMATQKELRKQFVVTVNYTMNQLWPTLYPYGDFTEIKLHVDEGDYVLKLLSKSGGWNNADGGVSGGERSIASLALRIAFALTLAPNLRMLILDEPTSNLDTKSLSELAITLRERVGEFMDQVILITHEEELEESATGNVYKLNRDKFNDDITNIVQIQ